jgi:hypothetical protein
MQCIVIQISNPNQVYRHHFLIEHSNSGLNKACEAFNVYPTLNFDFNSDIYAQN